MDKILVYCATGKPVAKGDRVKNFRGEGCEVLGWHAPRHANSTGRVYLKLDALSGWAEYYPSVINAEWRDRREAKQ